MENPVISSPPADHEFVDLDRTLREIPVGETLTDELDLLRRISSGTATTWADLTDEMRIVVLAEAGAGKTWEIRQLAERLRRGGKQAFFVRLELVAHDIDLAFGAAWYPVFRAWLASQDEGWLLLDSVDETRLRHPSDFDVAIRRLAAVLGAAISRVHIVITGRISAWRPATDLALCAELLPHPTPLTRARSGGDDRDGGESTTTTERGAAITRGYRLLALDDLNDEQKQRFIRARGVAEPAGLMDAIERADAEGFAGRPQDLDELVDFWRDNNRIGTRWEILTASIGRRLVERDQNRAEVQPLSQERALDGAKALAAAVTLVGVPAIAVLDGTEGTVGLPAAAVLVGWTTAETGVLLQRPIFDGAIYGTVRFHHRSVREFLAAQWFADRLELAPSRLGIEQLFFRRQYGIEVVSPMLRPILPWLVLMDDRIRRRVLALAPEVVFEGGDPSRLPLDDQKRILADVCDLMAKGTSSRSVQDYSSVQRFANGKIAGEIRRLLALYAGHQHVIPFLLRMVWLGELRDLAPEVIALATVADGPEYTRLTAVRALNAIGTTEEMASLREAVLGQEGELDRRLISELISGLDGRTTETDWILRATRRVAGKRKHAADHLTHELAAYVERCSVIDQALLDGFEALLATEPMQSDLNNQVSRDFEWVLPAASRAIGRLIGERSPALFTSSGHSIIRRVSMARSFQSEALSGEKEALRELVPDWPELNRAQFWHDVGAFRALLAAKDKGRLTEWWRPGNFGAAWRFDAGDFGYVLEAISSRQVPDDRLVALSLAFHLYDANGRPAEWLDGMTAAASAGELADRLHDLLHPAPPDAETRKLLAQDRQWKRRDRKRQAAEQKERREDRANLIQHLPMLREELSLHPENAGRLNAIRYLFDQTREDEQHNHWSSYDWRRLVPEFGEDLAALFRDAALRFWRLNRPVLRSEGAPANETAFSSILGLAGLDIETRDDPSCLAAFSAEEVEIAARYALLELNGFPAWFPKLYEHHRSAVAEFLLRQIEWELSRAEEENRGVDVLSDVSWSGQWAWKELGPALVELLGELEPADGAALGKAIKIVRGSEVPDEVVASLAAAHCSRVTDTERLGQWFAVWIGSAPDVAVPSFASRLSSLAGESATELAMHVVVGLLGSDRYEGPLARAGFLKPSSLAQLYELMHRHIRRADDINRVDSGVYSPGLRDHAQDARDSILDKLRDLPGKEALLALRTIAAAQSGREWLTGLLRNKAEREGDIEAFSATEVVGLGTTFERRPTTAAQLGDTARLRLHQLREAAEEHRSLPGSVLDIADIEGVTTLVRSQLSEQSNNAYGVATASSAVASLRLAGIGYAANQPIVLTTSELTVDAVWIDTLDGNNSSRRGVLAVIHMARTRRWRLPWSPDPTLDQATKRALAQWEMAEASRPGLDDVEVVGIDLTKTPAPQHPKDGLQRILDFLRWLWGTTLLRIGGGIITTAVAALTGILPGLIEAAFDIFLHKQIDIVEPAWWTGWVLLPIGILFVLAGIVEKRRER
ncbi:hypothetical protein [Devosia sp.]|uniref:hypothetical protein n=1 Tax=Devosia sp. TaxID=1871048 RepID=UPI003F72436E